VTRFSESQVANAKEPQMSETITERMLAGALYCADHAELVRARNHARRRLVSYASTLGEETTRRADILRELLGSAPACGSSRLSTATTGATSLSGTAST
jgi:Maltose acetyltransferase